MSSPFEPSLPPVSREDDLRPYPQQVFIITPTRRRWWLHLLLLLCTVFTTLVMGARLQYNFLNNLPPFRFDEDLFPIVWAVSNPRNLLLGVPFSFTLMIILLAHEMGHFFYCLKYHVYATLPFFIPAPTLIGTFGAFIRIKSPIPTRRALFDIGIAGPIAGFVLAVPAAAIGLLLSKHTGVVVKSELKLSYPLLFHGIHRLIPWGSYGGGSPTIDTLYLHPVALAAWIGLLATTLNLVPGGQLDGGHILYSTAPRIHRRVTLAVAIVLLPMALFCWGGWFVWAIFLFFIGGRHPEVSLQPPLDAKRKLLALVAALIFLVSALPAPFQGASLLDSWAQYQTERQLEQR
ncbi:MAG TPA: site-2 protease family protein [Terriglobales bacterium]|nr:site-2 protease family protein [Terriglobales bacterium]